MMVDQRRLTDIRGTAAEAQEAGSVTWVSARLVLTARHMATGGDDRAWRRIQVRVTAPTSLALREPHGLASHMGGGTPWAESGSVFACSVLAGLAVSG